MDYYNINVYINKNEYEYIINIEDKIKDYCSLLKFIYKKINKIGITVKIINNNKIITKWMQPDKDKIEINKNNLSKLNINDHTLMKSIHVLLDNLSNFNFIDFINYANKSKYDYNNKWKIYNYKNNSMIQLYVSNKNNQYNGHRYLMCYINKTSLSNICAI